MDPLSAPGVAADTESLLKLRHVVRNIPERHLAPTGLPGGFVTRRRGRGLETVDVRTFAFGDDIRHLDRNTTARTGEPHVRTFRDERDRSGLLLADFRPSMLWGTRRALRSVAAAEALAMTGWRIVDAGGRVGLLAFGSGEPLFVPPRGRTRGMVDVVGGLAAAHRRALEAAAAGPDAEEPPLEEALELAARLGRSGGFLVLGSGLDRPGRNFDAMACALDRRTALTILLITDRFERSPPDGSYPFTTGGAVRWASCRAGRRPKVTDVRLERMARAGIRTVAVDASVPPEAMAEQLDFFDGGRR
ncbi:Protein of unknown function DUF58 [Tistlia consotensis]|uniref:DUF58 domain-containing protein n=1 Tax=Tistlia consotensis USBA 355 TaxID=560819 RepID=A0A1Y6C8S2_9PROT|nr:DUF58 domain-containing protein [Tistlia consotensis]SMF51831.1 Protein of unknown function DUF58 [Tistlia consotensis USBA 355]SNR83725.1 Protein of unknown function DUF58 [Tistlia consotensis]